MNINNKPKGEIIRQIRRDRGKTQAEVAEAIGSTTSTLSRWENGNRKIPADKFDKILEFLSVEVTINY